MVAFDSRAVRKDTFHTVGLVEPHLEQGDRLLDVGCGAGWVTATLAERGFADIWGIDIVDGREAEIPNFALYDGLHLDFPDGHFDVVMLNFVLHHVPNERKPQLVGEARRVCRRALFVVEDTPRNWVDRFFSRRHGERHRRRIGSDAGFGFFSRAEWEAFFADQRLDVVESRALGRFCRDWLQPFARSMFVLRPRAGSGAAT